MITMRLDSGESAFFKRQLEFIKARTFDTKYKELRYAMFIPVSSEVPSGSEFVTYHSFSLIGVAKIISNYAKDFPRVDIFGEENTRLIKDLGAAYGWSIKEIRRAARAGTNLNARKATAARRAIEQKHNEVAWFGDSVHGLNGLIDYPGISQYTIPVGAGASTTWALKTPDEILADLNGIVTSIISTTNGVEQPNQILLPIDQFRLISTTRVTDGDSNTILRFFMSNNPGVSVDWLTELSGAGAGGLDRILCYVRNPNNLQYEAPVVFEQFQEQQEGMEFEVPVHAETAGVEVYYPASVAYGDGI